MICHICDRQNTTLTLKLQSPLCGIWDIYECQICTTQFVYPIPSPKERSRFYDQVYRGGSLERSF